MAEHPRRYRFGPLERRGLIGSLRIQQVAVLGTALVAAVLGMRASPTGGGVPAALAVVLAASAACFWPFAGRTAEEWIPIAIGHAWRRLYGDDRYRSSAPTAGISPAHQAGRRRTAPPRAMTGVDMLAWPLRGEEVGVVRDRRCRSYTAALAVRVASFGLLDRAEQEARQAAWGAVLAGMAREGSPVSRVQWIERTVPADGDEIGRYLGEAWDRDAVAPGSLQMRSYLDLVSAAPGVTRDHELVVALQIEARRAWRQIKRSGGRAGADAGACSVLMREMEILGERLAGADVQVVGALRPFMLAQAIRVAFDPWSRLGSARLAAARPRDRLDEVSAWPVAADTGWSTYRADGAFHATYWIASWPRTDVGVAFLSPLLLHGQVVRAIAVTIEPVPPLRAVREVESARTSDAADQELRQRFGFVETARRRRISEATLRREQELADGHAAVRYAGFVTVSARDEEELDRHCAEVEHASQMAHLELIRLYGQQDVAFTYTLPLCRGLR